MVFGADSQMISYTAEMHAAKILERAQATFMTVFFSTGKCG